LGEQQRCSCSLCSSQGPRIDRADEGAGTRGRRVGLDRRRCLGQLRWVRCTQTTEQRGSGPAAT
jgi:hypothetical protein